MSLHMGRDVEVTTRASVQSLPLGVSCLGNNRLQVPFQNDHRNAEEN